MSGGSTTNTTQQQATTQLPPWVNTAAQQNYAYAQNVANQPLQQYQGQTVADVGPQMQQAWNTAASGGGAGQDQYNAAQAGYLAGMGQTPQQVTPQTLSGANLQPYMNPYTQNVINSTLPIMQQALGAQQSGIGGQAAMANAYGGSRQAIQQGVAQSQGALNMAQMAGQLNQANYAQAQQGAQYDINNNLQSQQLNQAAQQNQLSQNLQAASGMANLGQQAQLSQVRNFGEQETAGALEQQQAQNQINAQMAGFQNAFAYPGQQLGVLESALGMTPYGQASQGQSTSQTTSSPNWASVALGGLSSLGGLFSAPAGGTSAASGILGFLSDRGMKTDISKIGVHGPTGLPMYAYRYKGDPKSYPKTVGPMAEDVMKIAPHAVSSIPGSGGKKAVNLGALGLGATGGLPQTQPLRPPGMKGLSLPSPNLAAIAGTGPLAAPVPINGVGALGRNMLGAPMQRGGIKRPRPPQLRGAMGG
jgi:hypothetical protein